MITPHDTAVVGGFFIDGMTLSDELLKKWNQGCYELVYEVTRYPSGDYWHSTLARTPSVECAEVMMSEYHGAMKVVDRESEDPVKEVVLL